MSNPRSSMNTQRQLLLGIFFIVALSILAFYTLFLTDIHVFSKPTLMTVYFPDANNLREGDPVQLLGARIGRVKEVTPVAASERNRRIRTVLSLEKEVELLEDATISIRETSLLGGRHVFIDPGTFGGLPKKPNDDGSYTGTVYKNPIASFGDIGEQLSTVLSENREKIKSFIANVDAISADVRAAKGLIGRLVSDADLATDARTVVADARKFMANASDASEQLKSGKGLVGALLYDEAMKQQFSDTIASLKQIGDDVKDQKGVLGSLINDSALRDKITKGIDSFVAFGEKLNSGDGALAMLLSDPETKAQVKALVADLSSTMTDMKSLVADVKAGKGTVGKLMTEDGLYQDLRTAIGVLNRSLEDYREAAPITAFTSVLFAAF